MGGFGLPELLIWAALAVVLIGVPAAVILVVIMLTRSRAGRDREN